MHIEEKKGEKEGELNNKNEKVVPLISSRARGM